MPEWQIAPLSNLERQIRDETEIDTTTEMGDHLPETKRGTGHDHEKETGTGEMNDENEVTQGSAAAGDTETGVAAGTGGGLHEVNTADNTAGKPQLR